MRPNLTTLATIALASLALGVAMPAAATEGTDDVMPLDFLFIHHSCGGQLLADPGEQVGGERDSGERCIYVSHPNGGGLRASLEAGGYRVNEASYGSIVGEDTDICHWRHKFAEQMDRILRTRRNDELLPGGETNEIVAFKSCYPNNGFTGRGSEPGDPDDCERTVANAMAAYRSLLDTFREQPEVLFVAFTAPPLAEYTPVGWKARIKSWFQDNERGGDLAREFNAWLADRERGWLAGYELPNVVVFDYYDILTEHGKTNYAAYPARANDSHPSREGNQVAAAAFAPFLEAAVAGMDWPRP
jgi:hypothetical protein